MLDIMMRAFNEGGEAPPFSRRQALAGGALPIAALAATPAMAAVPSLGESFSVPQGRIESHQISFPDNVAKLNAEMRLYRELADEADVLLWYFFTMFVVAEGRTVQPLVRFEGIEFSHHKKVGENLYMAHGHNASYPRDINTGEFITEMINPLTKQKITVPPTILTEDPGMLYGPEGKRPLNRKTSEFTPRYSLFRVEDGLVKAEEIRVPPDGWFTPFIEASHNWTPKALYDDAKIKRLPMGTSGGYVFPYPKWLEMGDIKGHMFAIWSGRKLDGVHQLPKGYFDRASALHPELLKVDLSKFTKAG
jgi:hypothetical protein